MTRPRSDRSLFFILGFALLASYAYFYQGGGWNQNSRFALVRAMTEHNTLQIDAYRQATGDRAVWNGHFYSDKAPGASLLAFVPVEAVRALNIATGIEPGFRCRHYADVLRGNRRRVRPVHRGCRPWRAVAVAFMGLLAWSRTVCGNHLRCRHARVVLCHAVHGPRPVRRMSDDCLCGSRRDRQRAAGADVRTRLGSRTLQRLGRRLGISGRGASVVYLRAGPGHALQLRAPPQYMATRRDARGGGRRDRRRHPSRV